ncbi:hypothetical protein PYW08_010410 [Mythimna loreyi]|uniref:Uncharacterized protein n=1 Tax=Mythimna loreyi TaxID=667449 RepID=A0ACC2Q769_9NEOP|nr:hypothetical protein PYW08_010410 [Mythimna loreyi]
MECCNDKSVTTGDNILKCSVCRGKHHTACLNLVPKQVAALGNKYRASWKCPSCCNVTRRGGSNLNTPVRSYTELPACDHSMDMSCDNLDQMAFGSSPSVNNKTQVAEKLLTSVSCNDFASFTQNLRATLSEWRADMNRDMLLLRDDIQSTLAEVRNEMQTLRSEQILIKQRVTDLRDDVIVLQTSSQSQSTEYEILKKRVDELNSRPAADVSELISGLETKIDLLAQQARQCNVEICNLPEKRNENLPAIIEAIGTALKSPISLSSIVSVHRVPHAHQQNTRPKNVILKLTSRLHRDNLLSAFRKAGSLKTDQIGIAGTPYNIYLNEHLTLAKKQLFRKVRDIAKKRNHKYVWINNGTILVREREGASAFAIRSDNDINKIKTKSAE